MAARRDSSSTYSLLPSCVWMTSISSTSSSRAGHCPVLRHTTQRTISARPCNMTSTPATGITVAGVLVMLQGLAEIVRCVVCLKTGQWPARLEDVEEIDVIQTQLGKSEYVDEESRRIAMEGAHAIDEAARHRSAVEHKNP